MPQSHAPQARRVPCANSAPSARLIWRLRGAWQALVQPLPEPIRVAPRHSRALEHAAQVLAPDTAVDDAAAAAAEDAAAVCEPPVRGCGWFDSSLDLREGLQVDEVAAPQWPLAWWLQWQLGASGAARPAPCPSAQAADGNEGSPAPLLH